MVNIVEIGMRLVPHHEIKYARTRFHVAQHENIIAKISTSTVVQYPFVGGSKQAIQGACPHLWI